MLKLYLHPLSSYCHKALIAFYENAVAFEPVVIDGDSFADFKRLWPLGKFPLLHDQARDELIPESSIIIEYLTQHYPGPVQLICKDPDLARRIRSYDRFFDNYLHAPMQKLAAERMRPADARDPFGLSEAKSLYIRALDILETELPGKRWMVSDAFSMADCAAAPALFYGDRFYGPFRDSHPLSMAYLERLKARPSYARALKEAEPYFHMLPQ